MQLQNNTQEVEIEGATSKTMTISDDPIIWRMLTTQLYTQTYAWIREYAQNARDADKDWRLIMPSMHSPFVEFIDNGGGMTKHFMQTKFCQAGFSTKREDNDKSGGFGIGRLSGPQGTIFECRNEDAIRTWSLVKDKNSIPSLILLAEEERPSDVKLGVTVRVPVAPREIESVKGDIQKMLKFFGLPNLPEIKFIMNERNWAIVDQGSQYSSYPTIVEVGGYTFPVRQSDISGAMSSLSYAERDLMNAIFREGNYSYLLLRIPVGSVNIALNRESIKFDEPTIKQLLEIAKLVVTEMAAATQKEFENIQTRWEAKVKYGQLANNGLHGLFASIAKNLTWNGEPVGDKQYRITPAKDNILIENFYGRKSKVKDGELPMNIRLPSMSVDPSRSQYLDPANIETMKVVILDDTEEFVSRKLRAVFTPHHTAIYLIRPGVYDPVAGQTVYEDGEWWTKALELLDPPKELEILKMSEIVPVPVPPRVRPAPGTSNVVRNKFFVSEPGAYLSFVGSDVDMSEDHVWVPYHANQADEGDSLNDKKNWMEYAKAGYQRDPAYSSIHTIREALGRDFKIIGVPRNQRNKVPDNWTHILDHVADNLAPKKEWPGILAWVETKDFDSSYRSLIARMVSKTNHPAMCAFEQKVNDFCKTKAEMQEKYKLLLLVQKPALKASVDAFKKTIPDLTSEFKALIDGSPALSIITKCNFSALNDAEWKFLVASI
jgi:hypothetical protein